MTQFNRRNFLKLLGGSVALGALPFAAKAGSPYRVVVVGGGFGGASVAKYLRMWGGSAVSVTLIDPSTSHVSCIGSNQVLNGHATIASLTNYYTKLQNTYGVSLMTDTVQQIDPIAYRLHLASGATVDYDRVVVAPGIDFDTVAGLDYNKMPHAWKAGTQTTLLKNQLSAMSAGGNFVMAIPPTPFRAHAAPYERACVVADFFKRKKPGSKVLILDANASIAAMPTTFKNAFLGTYANIIEYKPSVTLNSADATTMTLNTSIGAVAGSVINVIPRQKAGAVLFSSGLIPAGSRWSPVNPLNYESTLFPGVHILGDAQSTGQAKSGHMANSQAKVCADAILRSLTGLAPDAAPVTSAASFPQISSDTASWSTTTYYFDTVSRSMKAVAGTPAEAPSPTQDLYSTLFDWQKNLFSDTYN